MSFSAESTVTPIPKTLLSGLVTAVFLVPILVGFFAPTGTYAQNQLTNRMLASDQAEQAGAVGCLRSIITAEAFYSKQYQAGWSPTLASLGVPRKGMQPSVFAAGLLDNSLTSGTRRGYIFTYTAGPQGPSGSISKYSVTARPMSWKKGVRSFFADQTGVTRWTDKNRPPRATDAPIK